MAPTQTTSSDAAPAPAPAQEVQAEVLEQAPAGLPAMVPGGALATTVRALMMKALECGSPIDVLERLMALDEKQRAAADERAFHLALSTAQGEFPPIPKTHSVEGKYKYAPLDALMDAITPVLQRNGLSTSFERAFVSGEDGVIKAVSSALVIRHQDGFSHTFAPVVMPIERGTNREGRFMISAAQAVGVAMTYADRYAYQGGLGFRPCDEDTDGQTRVQPTPPAARAPVQQPQRASAAPPAAQQAAPAPTAAPFKLEGLPPGWRQVIIERIVTKATSKGGTKTSAKIAGAPDDMCLPSTFSTRLAKMLTTAKDSGLPILVHVVRAKDPRYFDILDVRWPDNPPGDGRAPLDPSCDDPANYMTAEELAAGRQPGQDPDDSELPY